MPPKFNERQEPQLYELWVYGNDTLRRCCLQTAAQAPEDRRRFLGNDSLTNRNRHRDELPGRNRRAFRR
jgi:hypothetical protein